MSGINAYYWILYCHISYYKSRWNCPSIRANTRCFVFRHCDRYLSMEKLPSNLARRKSLRFTIKLQIHITQNTLQAFTARHAFMCHEEKISIHSMYRLQASRTCALPTFLTDLHENRAIKAFVIISFTFFVRHYHSKKIAPHSQCLHIFSKIIVST